MYFFFHGLPLSSTEYSSSLNSLLSHCISPFWHRIQNKISTYSLNTIHLTLTLSNTGYSSSFNRLLSHCTYPFRHRMKYRRNILLSLYIFLGTECQHKFSLGSLPFHSLNILFLLQEVYYFSVLNEKGASILYCTLIRTGRRLHIALLYIYNVGMQLWMCDGPTFPDKWDVLRDTTKKLPICTFLRQLSCKCSKRFCLAVPFDNNLCVPLIKRKLLTPSSIFLQGH
jgi:hypothetical protein